MIQEGGSRMHFSSKIKKFCEGMNVYEHLLEDEKAIHIPFALSFTVTITTINGQLRAFLVDLANKECQEIPDIDFDSVTDICNIMSQKLKHDMAVLDDMTVREHIEVLFGEQLDKKPSEIYDFIYGNALTMTDMLKKAHKELKHADLALFGRYVSRRISEGNWDDVKDAYTEWKQNQSDFSQELLLEKQEQELNKYLKAGIMDPLPTPSIQKMKKVDYDYHTELQAYDFKDSDDYKMAYTNFMRFATRHDGMLTIDYKKYGHYIFNNYKKFSESQKVAVFELCVILSLIHQDILGFIKEDKRLPAELASEKAMYYWERLQKSHFVDNHYMLCADVSKKQAMYIADLFAEKLKLKVKWKFFEELWNIKNLAQEKWKMHQTGVLPTRYKDIYRIFKE